VEVAIVPAYLDSLLIGLYVLGDEFFIDGAVLAARGRSLTPSWVCLAVAQVLLDCPRDRKFLAWARWRLGHLFPYLPKQPGCTKRIRALGPRVARLLNLLIFEPTSIHDEQRRPALMRPSKVMSKAFGLSSSGWTSFRSRLLWVVSAA
jgi:hypothetical protein